MGWKREDPKLARVTCCWRPEQESRIKRGWINGLSQIWAYCPVVGNHFLDVESAELPVLSNWYPIKQTSKVLVTAPIPPVNHSQLWWMGYQLWDISHDNWFDDSLLISHKPTWWIMSSHSPSRQVHSGQPAEFHGLDALHQHPRCPNQSLGPDLNGELAFDGRTWDDPGLVLAIQSGSRKVLYQRCMKGCIFPARVSSCEVKSCGNVLAPVVARHLVPSYM